jgi:hypothetical protein
MGRNRGHEGRSCSTSMQCYGRDSSYVERRQQLSWSLKGRIWLNWKLLVSVSSTTLLPLQMCCCFCYHCADVCQSAATNRSFFCSCLLWCPEFSPIRHIHSMTSMIVTPWQLCRTLMAELLWRSAFWWRSGMLCCQAGQTSARMTADAFCSPCLCNLAVYTVNATCPIKHTGYNQPYDSLCLPYGNLRCCKPCQLQQAREHAPSKSVSWHKPMVACFCFAHDACLW